MFATPPAFPAFPCSFRVKLLQGIQIFDRLLLDRVCACVWKIDCPRDTGAVVVVWYDARRITIRKGESGGRAARIISAARLIDWLRHAVDAAGSGGRRNDQDLETEERGDDFFSSTFHCCADYSSSRQRECHRSAPHKQKRVQSFPGYGGRLWYVQVLVFSPAPAPFKYAFKPFLDFCNCSRSRTEFQNFVLLSPASDPSSYKIGESRAIAFWTWSKVMHWKSLTLGFRVFRSWIWSEKTKHLC